ncbi:MAG: DUF3185 family protein [Balneolaceae bacterium]|nr:MAG: DUF3185 family protein [Balneolaceae bacterium]
MSEGSFSGLYSNTIWFPAILLIAGLSLLWMGNRELILFQETLPAYLSLRPETSTIWLLIFGTASSVAGITGLLRGRHSSG